MLCLYVLATHAKPPKVVLNIQFLAKTPKNKKRNISETVSRTMLVFCTLLFRFFLAGGFCRPYIVGLRYIIILTTALLL